MLLMMPCDGAWCPRSRAMLKNSAMRSSKSWLRVVPGESEQELQIPTPRGGGEGNVCVCAHRSGYGRHHLWIGATLLRGINDSPEDALKMVQFLGIPVSPCAKNAVAPS